jgi:hypothetical protein
MKPKQKFIEFSQRLFSIQELGRSFGSKVNVPL